MTITFADTLLFKSKYRLAQQYNQEQKWLDSFVNAIRQESDVDAAVFVACEECGFF